MASKCPAAMPYPGETGSPLAFHQAQNLPRTQMAQVGLAYFARPCPIENWTASLLTSCSFDPREGK